MANAPVFAPARRTRQMPASAPPAMPPQMPRPPDHTAKTPYQTCGDLGRGGDVEVDPAADNPGRDGPGGHVADQAGLAARGPPPAARDDDRQGDADHVHETVEVHVERPQVKPVGRRARDEGEQPMMLGKRHAPSVNPGGHRYSRGRRSAVRVVARPGGLAAGAGQVAGRDQDGGTGPGRARQGVAVRPGDNAAADPAHPALGPQRQAAATNIRLAKAAACTLTAIIGRSPAGTGSAGQFVGTASRSAPPRAGTRTHSGNSTS